MTNQTKMGNSEWLLLFTLALLWGGSFFFIELAIEGLQPFTIVLMRVGLAALILLAVAISQGEKLPRSAKTWGGFVMMSLVSNVLPFSLITWGQTAIESGLASIMLATTPIFTVILAHFFTADERLTVPRLIGVLLGVIGVTLLVGPNFLRGVGAQVMGQLAVLAAAASYGLSALVARKMMSGSTPLVNSAGMLSCATIFMLPLAFIFEQPWTASPGFVPLLAALALAIVSTALAYLLYFQLVARAGASNASLVTLLIPVTAVLLGAIFLGERLPLIAFGGMGVIFCGLLVIDGRIFGR